MLKYICTVAILFLSSHAFGQKEIKLEEVKEHVGDSVKLMARICGGKYLPNVKGSLTFLNVGAKYPNTTLTTVIWGDTRKQFTAPPEEMYNQGYVKWIAGKIELYNGRPEIVVTDPNQIWDVGN